MDTSKSSSTTRSPSFSEGSAKTSSGKSDASSVGKERDEDFTKDNAASPVDLECQIQAERITKLLDEVIYKTKLSICLPKLVHEFNILSSILSPHHLDDLGDISLKNRLNPELGHLLYILKNRPEPWLAYLQQTEQFRDLMLRQMTGTAADELAAKYKIQIIAKLEREVSLYKHESDIKLKKKILDSDRQMVLATRSHDVKYEMLKDEDIETKAGYENVLKRHLTDETNQREKLAEQNTKFIPLMEEREIEYHQEMTEKLNWFLVQHAARVIQYSWRNVLANRAEKKKLKKLEKKMLQAAEEALKKRPVKK
ncbi:Uncharacterized protein OBRU01_00346 [Operophtera brumata]|uniref:Dynein regulatory complex protein 10 n=1 Tax=Operophtera brumata TaxID=104452 RepID=A0A0L7LU75_OPEBR|nr:Uncharacterized protein OBRU01_00346 [Operophtera brumata]